MLRNRITYAILLISSSLLVYYEPNLITSMFFHTVVFLLLLSIAHLLYSYLAIKVSQKLDPIVVEHGHNAQYKCSVYNESLLPLSSITVNFLFHSVMFKGQLEPKTFTLMSGKSKHFDFDLSCKYRGVYSLGVETLDITDILNIFKLKVRNIESKTITVLPKVTYLNNFYIAPKSESDANANHSIMADDANSMVDIRKYENGDSLKHVHWKLSARYDEILVRNLERSAQNSTLLFLDTSKGNYSLAKNIIVEDKLMEALVSVANQCFMQNHIVQMNYYNFNPISITYSGKDDFNSFYTNIAKVSFRQPKNIKDFLDDYIISQYYKQSLREKDIFIFTCHLSQIENSPIIQELLSSRCSLHIVSCALNPKSTGSYRTGDGINHYNLSPYSDLQDIFIRSAK